MIFELGKYYKHTSGTYLKIVGIAETTIYGTCFIAEEECGQTFTPVGKTEDHAMNYVEVSKEEYINNYKDKHNEKIEFVECNCWSDGE